VPTGSGGPRFSKAEELGLYDSLVRTNQFTLLVSMRTSNLEQTGPARIITYSQDRTHRSFTLGQIRNSLSFRLRTPESGTNGNAPSLISGPVLSLNHIFFVAEVYDGRVSKLYVDGNCVGQVDLGAKRPRLPKRISAWLPALDEWSAKRKLGIFLLCDHSSNRGEWVSHIFVSNGRFISR
jgi:Concanavalin A-like lectin/glucanases superfamily